MSDFKVDNYLLDQEVYGHLEKIINSKPKINLKVAIWETYKDYIKHI